MLVKNIALGSEMTNVNGTLFFSSYNPTSGQELWKSDGTAAGTMMVKDINPGVASSEAFGVPTNVNGTLFFSATDGTHGYELWKSDGTAAGTVMVADIIDGGASSNPWSLTNVNGTLFFSARDSTVGRELWKSDGTAAGTTVVKDINPGSGGSGSYDITNVNGTLFFQANDGMRGVELWQSDGTAAGTVMTADINPGSASSSPFNLTNANGILLFTADDGIHGAELWAVQDVSSTPAPSLDVKGFPTTTTAGAAGSFMVTARNADGTTNTGYTGTVQFSSTDPQATIINPATGSAITLQGFTYTFTAGDAGVHTFSATLKTAGTQSLTATDTLTPAETATEGRILVKPADASTMTIAGFPSTTTAGVARNVIVALADRYGNVATGYTGTVHFTSSDAKATLPANYTFTAADAGSHTFSATLKTAGTRSITAADTLTSALTATEGGITVNTAAASKFIVTAPSSVKAGVSFNLTLTVADAYGNVVIGYTGRVHFTSTDMTALLPANYTFTAADKGVHTFTGLVLRKKEKQKITIADTLNGSIFANVAENVT
jgi:ELWxxDGT repeat protein